MLLNFLKCKCLHTGPVNENIQYTTGGTVIRTTVKEPKRT